MSTAKTPKARTATEVNADPIVASATQLERAEAELATGRAHLAGEARAAAAHLEALVAEETAKLRAPAALVAERQRAAQDLEQRQAEEAAALAAHQAADRAVADPSIAAERAALDLQTAGVVLTRARAAHANAAARLAGVEAELERAKVARFDHPALPAPLERLRVLRARRRAALVELRELDQVAVAVAADAGERLIRGQWDAMKLGDDIEVGGRRLNRDPGPAHPLAVLRVLLELINDGPAMVEHDRPEEQVAAILEGRWVEFKAARRLELQAREEADRERVRQYAQRDQDRSAIADAKIRVGQVEAHLAKARAWISEHRTVADVTAHEQVAAKFEAELATLKARITASPANN